MKKSAIILALSLLLPAAIAGADDNKFRSHMLGFAVEKPSSWQFLSANTYLDQAKQSRLNDAEMQKHWEQSMRAPLVVIAKYPVTHPDVNTTFKADAKPYGQLPANSTGMDIIKVLLPFFRKNFSGFEVVNGPGEVELAGLKAGYIKINYVNIGAGGVKYPSTSEMWVVPRKSHFFILGGGYKRGDADGPQEVAQIVQTLVIE